MNRTQLEEYAAKLEATGIHFAKSMGHKGNLTRLEDVSWEQAIVIIMSLKGWRIVEEGAEAVELDDAIPHLRLEP